MCPIIAERLHNGAWTFGTSTDPLNDSLTTTARLVATQGEGLFGEPVSLVLRCHSEITVPELDIYIIWNSYLGIDSPTVTTRFDDEEASSGTWKLSANSTTAFYPSVNNHVKARYFQTLISTDRLVAQVAPYGENPVTAVFDLDGIDQVGPQILKACGR